MRDCSKREILSTGCSSGQQTQVPAVAKTVSTHSDNSHLYLNDYGLASP